MALLTKKLVGVSSSLRNSAAISWISVINRSGFLVVVVVVEVVVVVDVVVDVVVVEVVVVVLVVVVVVLVVVVEVVVVVLVVVDVVVVVVLVVVVVVVVVGGFRPLITMHLLSVVNPTESVAVKQNPWNSTFS